MAIYMVNGKAIEIENSLEEKIITWDCMNFDELMAQVEDWEIGYIDNYLKVSPLCMDAVIYWKEKGFKSAAHAKVYEFVRQEMLVLLDEIEARAAEDLINWFKALVAITQEVYTGKG